MAFSPGGIMYVKTFDNVYRVEGAGQTPLIAGAAVIPGALTIDARVFAAETSANYTYSARGELIQGPLWGR